LKSGGSGRPFGRRAFGSLSSSKKGWIQASTYQNIIRHTYSGLASDADPKQNMEVEYVTKSEKSYEILYRCTSQIRRILEEPTKKIYCFRWQTFLEYLKVTNT